MLLLYPLPFLEGSRVPTGGPDSQRDGNSLPEVRAPRSGNTKSWWPFLERRGENYLSISKKDKLQLISQYLTSLHIEGLPHLNTWAHLSATSREPVAPPPASLGLPPSWLPGIQLLDTFGWATNCSLISFHLYSMVLLGSTSHLIPLGLLPASRHSLVPPGPKP